MVGKHVLKVASECPNKGRNRIEKDEIIVEKKTLTKRKFTNTENRNLKLENITNSTKRRVSQVFRKGKEFLLH